MFSKNRYKRSWAYGSNAVLTTVIFVGILFFIIRIAERHPWRLDLTEAGKYSLSAETRKILDNLKEPIRIKAFYQSASPEQMRAKDMLETYSYYSKNVTYEFIDPDRQPEIARNYEVRAYNTVALEGYGKKQMIQTDDEQSITNAILKMIHGEEKKIYFLIGHGEHSLQDMDKGGYSSVRAILEKENYKIGELNLMEMATAPQDAAVLIIAGPQKPLLKEEIATLATYVSEGGKLLVLLDPFHDGGLRNFVKAYGMELRDDIVIDKLSRVFGGSYLMPVVTQYGTHKITDGFNVATFYPEARSVRPLEKRPENVQIVVLAATSQDSWAETNLELLKQGQASFDEKEDMPGPVPLAVLSEIHLKEGDAQSGKEARSDSQPNGAGNNEEEGKGKTALLAVFGNSAFVDNTHFELSANGDFFLRALSYLADEDTLVTIKARDVKGKPLILTEAQARVIFVTSMIFVPLMVILAGLSVYRARRSYR